MMPNVRWSLLLCALAVTACSNDTAEVGIDDDVTDRTPYEQGNLTADTSEAYGTAAADPVTPVQGGARSPGAPLTATGQFRSRTGGQAPGSVTVTEDGSGTRFSVLVSDYTAGMVVRVAVVRGGCGERAADVRPLASAIRVGTDGIGSADAVLPVATPQLLDGRHSVRLLPERSPTDAGAADAALACAELPAVR